LIEKVKANEVLFEKEADLNANADIILQGLCKYLPNEESKDKPHEDVKHSTYVPTYIGIEITSSVSQIINVVEKACKEINKSASIDPKEGIKDLEKFIKNQHGKGWRYVKSYHVTALFIGSNHELTKSEIFTKFKENEKQEVQLGAIVIVPHKCVFAVCFTNILIGNKVPHITIMLNHCPPKNSNLYGEALFIGIEELKKKYEEGFFTKDGEEYLSKHQIKVDGKNCEAYVYKPENTVTLYGITKYFG